MVKSRATLGNSTGIRLTGWIGLALLLTIFFLPTTEASILERSVLVKMTEIINVVDELIQYMDWFKAQIFNAVLTLWEHVTSFSITIVISNSMEPFLSKGDLVIYKRVDPAVIDIGDVIAFKTQLPSSSLPDVTMHRVIDIVKKDGMTYFVTKGDNVDSKDATVVSPRDVIGLYQAKIPYVGYAFLFIRSPLGMLYIAGSAIATLLYSVHLKKKKQEEDFMVALLESIDELKRALKESELRQLSLHAKIQSIISSIRSCDALKNNSLINDENPNVINDDEETVFQMRREDKLELDQGRG